MSDTPARLVRLAQQLEDQHAPQHMTILMREAAKEMEQNLGQVGQLSEELERLRAALREAADELDAYYRAEYPGDHPYSQKKLAAAMAANPARAALGEKE